MAFVSDPMGVGYPLGRLTGIPSISSTTTTLDAATEKVVLYGRAYINGRPTSAKTISAAGGGSISFRLGTTTFANAGTTCRVGICDLDLANGPPARDDGAYDVNVDLTGGGGGLTTAAWNTVPMTGGSGSKDISHGDLIAVVIELTARAGADSVVVQHLANFFHGMSNPQCPAVSSFLASTWAAVAVVPTMVITFDDGTIATFDDTIPVSSGFGAGESFTNSSNPDERGEMFQVTRNCKIDAIFATAEAVSGTDGTWEVNLYADPLGTPTSLLPGGAALPFDPQVAGSVNNYGYHTFPFATEIELARNTDYCVAVKATGANNIILAAFVLGNAAYRAFLPGTTTLRGATRNNGSGAFAESTTTHRNCGVRISAFDDGTGAGAAGGLIRHPGMVGGLNA